jgi:4-amino-4-deoxy-L-arabinose transferase-like glycosyltransferase
MTEAPASGDVALPTPPFESSARGLVWAYRLFPVLLLPLMLVLSRDFGITWDEKTHQLYGERVFRFLTQGLDDDWFRPGDNLFIYLHGGLFDTVCVALQQVLPGDMWMTRHYVNAAFGWLGIFYVGRLGRLLGGPGTGLLAMALLSVSPRYFGDSMNNPKDLPLAALLTVALYYLMRLEPRYPYLGWRLAVPLVLSMALAVNVRAGALVFLGYLAIALAGLTLVTREFSVRRLAATLARFAGVAGAVLLLGTIFWPWAQVRPLTRPLQGMARLSQFRWDFPVLFAGKDVPAGALPWNYIPQWLLITTPPVVLVGAALALLVLLRLRLPDPAAGAASGLPPRPDAWRVLGLWFAALFPATYIVVSGATVYDGIRHLLFTYPPLVALAACGWRLLLDSPRHRLRMLAAAALALGLVEPLVFQWRNHPNQAVYFNAFAGGPRGAFGRYELDYWGNSALQGVEWVDRVARASGTRVVISGLPHHLVRDDAQRFASLAFAREEEDAHHLEVVVLRGPRQDVLDLARRADVLHAVTTADGTPLTVVVPGPRYAEVAGTLHLAPARSLEAR